MRSVIPPSPHSFLQGGRRSCLLQWGLFAAQGLMLPGARAVPVKQRIVSVGGALTEIIFALQAEADLVGVDTTSQFPEVAQKLPSVGYARALSAEGVLALAPTRVIATEDAGPPAVLRQLQAAGVPVSVLAANHRFEGLCDRVQRLGQLVDRPREAQALQQGLRVAWERARGPIVQRAGKAQAPRVLFVLAHTPNQIQVAGSDTGAQAMLDYVEARNAISGFAGYKPLTPEAVIAAQPELVLVTDQGLKAAGGADGILRLPGLEQTTAGRQRRIVSLDAMFLLGFGPRLPAAVAALDAAIRKAMQS